MTLLEKIINNKKLEQDIAKWIFCYKITTNEEYFKELYLNKNQLDSFKYWALNTYSKMYAEHSNQKDYDLEKLLLESLFKLDKDFKINVLELSKKDLQNSIDKHKIKGINCPVCSKLVKQYKRTISNNMCKFLVDLLVKSKNQKNGWIHHSELNYTARDYPWLAWWGLTETQKDKDGKKSTTGYWRITELGKDFVLKEIYIPKFCYSYNGKPVSFSEELINFATASKQLFDLKKLMSNEYNTGKVLNEMG